MKKSKYNAKKVEVDGIIFDSKMESEFYEYLLTKHRKEDIVLQPVYKLLDSFKDKKGKLVRGITYKADFEVLGVLYDVKGMATPVFSIKEKLFKKRYPDIELKCVTKAPNYSGVEWIEISELKKLRKARKNKKD